MEGLARYVQAQKCYYESALTEVRNGKRQGHWIWYIFPQLKGLGYSSTAREYGIDGRTEAIEYISDPELRGRLVEISKALLECGSDSISDIVGYPEENNVRACMTLFKSVCPEEPVFGEVLAKFFNGEPDQKTLELLGDSMY